MRGGLYLGVDPGLVNCGVAILADRGRTLVVVRRFVLRPTGRRESWYERFLAISRELGRLVETYQMRGAAVEGVVWQGPRRGALQLAQLAGAIVGFLAGLLGGGAVEVVRPAWVKAHSASRVSRRSRSLTPHEADAVALARWAANAAARCGARARRRARRVR